MTLSLEISLETEAGICILAISWLIVARSTDVFHSAPRR